MYVSGEVDNYFWYYHFEVILNGKVSYTYLEYI